MSAKESDRISRRAKNYRWLGDTLFKRLERKLMVVVLRTAERMQMALDTHRSMGHFGVQRVLDRLQKNYLWRNMGDTVVATIQASLPFAQLKAGLREGATAAFYPGTWISVGCELCRPIGEKCRW